jgi:acyl-CoA synthetase (AMP-forming)/AMP-acid ligase II
LTIDLLTNPLGPFRRVEMLVKRDATLGSISETLAGVYGDARVVEQDANGLTLTYREAADLVDRWAGGIAARVVPGERVVIATDNGYEQILLCLAASRAGAIAAPVNAEMRADEIRHVEQDSQAALTIRSIDEVEGHAPLGTAYPADPGDSAALFYTSGTTGRPKGADLTHRALVGSLAPAVLFPSMLRRDEAVVSLSSAHIMGFAVLMGLACAGIPTYLITHFRPASVLDAIETRRSTGFVGVPAMYRLMLEAGAEDRDLSSVRVWGSGADSMPGELAARFKEMGATLQLPYLGAVGEATFIEAYGMVEVGGGVAAKLSPPMLGLGLGESVGLALPQYHMKVVGPDGEAVRGDDVGELLIKGPGVLKQYWNAPDATAAVVTDDGWLRTGDLARKGPFGTVRFVGRDKDVIKHGGYSVYALEVQLALEGHPGVAEAAVLGIPDDRLGEVPVAVVRLNGTTELDEAAMRAWLDERISDYKVPKRIIAVDDLPRTGTEKVQKRELRPLFDA